MIYLTHIHILLEVGLDLIDVFIDQTIDVGITREHIALIDMTDECILDRFINPYSLIRPRLVKSFYSFLQTAQILICFKSTFSRPLLIYGCTNTLSSGTLLNLTLDELQFIISEIGFARIFGYDLTGKDGFANGLQFGTLKLVFTSEENLLRDLGRMKCNDICELILCDNTKRGPVKSSSGKLNVGVKHHIVYDVYIKSILEVAVLRKERPDSINPFLSSHAEDVEFCHLLNSILLYRNLTVCHGCFLHRRFVGDCFIADLLYAFSILLFLLLGIFDLQPIVQFGWRTHTEQHRCDRILDHGGIQDPLPISASTVNMIYTHIHIDHGRYDVEILHVRDCADNLCDGE